MVNYRKILLCTTGILAQIFTYAQNGVSADTTAGNSFMRSEGKIYVAMTVAVTVLAGLIIFVGRLDRKISRLEKTKYN